MTDLGKCVGCGQKSGHTGWRNCWSAMRSAFFRRREQEKQAAQQVWLEEHGKDTSTWTSARIAEQQTPRPGT